MSALSIVHASLGLVVLIIGALIFSLRKGDPRHRWLGWTYVVLILVSLAAIIIGGRFHLRPFHVYAGVIAGGVGAAVLASRSRGRFPSWRSWHAALMSFSMLGALIATGGIVGGLALGAGNGPAYYQMFNLLIVGFTLIGLWIINTRPVIWGRVIALRERNVRLFFSAVVVAISAALVAAQWVLLGSRQ